MQYTTVMLTYYFHGGVTEVYLSHTDNSKPSDIYSTFEDFANYREKQPNRNPENDIQY